MRRELGLGQRFLVVFDIRVAGCLATSASAVRLTPSSSSTLMSCFGYEVFIDRRGQPIGKATMPEASGICGSATLDDCAAALAVCLEWFPILDPR